MTFSQTHQWAFECVSKKKKRERKSKQTRGSLTTGFTILLWAQLDLLSVLAILLICLISQSEALRLTSIAKNSTPTTYLIQCPLHLSLRPPAFCAAWFSASVCGPHMEPAAFQAAKITAEEENSSLPGIHIVAALQRDRLRQISSRRLKDWIWLSCMEEGYSLLPLLPLPLFLLLSDEGEAWNDEEESKN